MRAITEFPTHILTKGIQAKAALATEGKTPEEIQTAIGETFKYEGDKLKCFVTALDVAEQNMEKLTGVRVIQFNEGETIPPKAAKIEEFHYVPQFATPPGKPMTVKPTLKTKGKDKDKRGPKASPWGMSPEEIAAKKEASDRAKKAAAKPS